MQRSEDQKKGGGRGSTTRKVKPITDSMTTTDSYEHYLQLDWQEESIDVVRPE